MSISAGCVIGNGVRLSHCVVMRGVRIKDHSKVGQHVGALALPLSCLIVPSSVLRHLRCVVFLM